MLSLREYDTALVAPATTRAVLFRRAQNNVIVDQSHLRAKIS
jgi:hypothetical protein